MLEVTLNPDHPLAAIHIHLQDIVLDGSIQLDCDHRLCLGPQHVIISPQ